MLFSSKVPAQFDGFPLLDYLSARFTYLPPATWQQLLREGKITSPTGCYEVNACVVQGEVISCDLPDFAAPVVNFDYHVVYCDQWLLAINKPAGLRVHSGGRYSYANLMYHLRHHHHPPYPEANLVNRLDTDTSGLILLAREKDVLRRLMEQFAAGAMDKRYLAVVSGQPTPASGTIDLPLGPVAGAKVPRFEVVKSGGKAALTHYRTLRPLGSRHSLLELQPLTGRTHQLRVHLAAIGYPIAGDALYTMSDDDYMRHRLHPDSPRLWPRQALHSHSLTFHHPILQTSLTLVAPLTADIEQVMQVLT